jgi:hypothetical protein
MKRNKLMSKKTRNRTLEFLREAHSLLDYPIGNSDKAQLLVRLAIGEVEELLEQIPVPTEYGSGVLVVDAQRMTPARLETNSRNVRERRARAALPDGSY